MPTPWGGPWERTQAASGRPEGGGTIGGRPPPPTHLLGPSLSAPRPRRGFSGSECEQGWREAPPLGIPSPPAKSGSATNTPAPACTAFGNGAKGACALRPPPRGSPGKEGSGCGSSLLPHGTPPSLGLLGTTSETNHLLPHILISGSAFRGGPKPSRGGLADA